MALFLAGLLLFNFLMRMLRSAAITPADMNCRREIDLTGQTKDAPRRNKGFEATHRDIIDAAVRLISEKGVEALSMAAISRAVQINRTTLYYHFAGRDELIIGVKRWASEQLASGFNPDLPRERRMEHIARFVLENESLTKMFIDDFLSVGNIRDRYPKWDDLVAGFIGDNVPDAAQGIDPEVYCVMMLTSAFIAPRIFKNSVRPDMPLEEVVMRFRAEQMRVLQRDGFAKSATI